jgi:hypothetical protein
VSQLPLGASLRLVDPVTGEVTDARSHEELQQQVDMLERDLRAKRLRIACLEHELDEAEGTTPRELAVRAVLEDWKLVYGLNARTKTPLSGTRAAKARARLREGFTVDQLCHALRGGRESKWHMDTRYPHRRDVVQLLRDERTVEELIALADKAERPPLFAHTAAERSELCACSHMRVAHASKTDLGAWPCAVPGCRCIDFDDLGPRADEWLERERKRIRRASLYTAGDNGN